MFRLCVAIVLLLLLPQTAAAEAPAVRAQETETLTDAVVIALVIAGSIAAYKAMGKPCACPKDLMKNGRVCGGNSAWSRPGGYKPLCFPTDVTPAMINAYRATKTIPALK